jgi:phospholipase C
MSSCSRWADQGDIACQQWATTAAVTCKDWADHGSSQCSSWADEGSNQCSSWADKGHKDCASEYLNECHWYSPWNCIAGWLCQAWYWVANWICQAWYWVANWVCKAWYWVAEWVCLAFTYLVKLICTVWAWVAKLVCVLWTSASCAFRNIADNPARNGDGRIKHVIVLMLENRAFDHLLGFSQIDGQQPGLDGAASIINLVGHPQSNIDPSDPTHPEFATPGADFFLYGKDQDPSHEFEAVVRQLCGDGKVYPDPVTLGYPPINNTGFVASYRQGSDGQQGSSTPKRIMRCFSQEQLPVINALAREFCLCDNWFSSLPGPTWPNRFFMHAASSAGLDHSPSKAESIAAIALDGFRFSNGTIFDKLEDKCLDWSVYKGDAFPVTLALSGMTDNLLVGHFKDYDDFKEDVNSDDFSDSYVFIEPDYGRITSDFTCGNSMHPLDDITRGERLIKNVYETLRSSPIWEESLLLVVWDEHGGFYDHVPPPQAQPPGDVTTDEDYNQWGFDFSRFGVRVPGFVISPWIPRNLIDHTIYDHTSLLATIEQLFGLGSLTQRDAAANHLNPLCSLATPRTDAPVVLPTVRNSGFSCDDDPPWDTTATGDTSSPITSKSEGATRNGPSDLRWLGEEELGTLTIALRRDIAMSPKRDRAATLSHITQLVKNFSTRDQAIAYIEHVRGKALIEDAGRRQSRHKKRPKVSRDDNDAKNAPQSRNA